MGGMTTATQPTRRLYRRPDRGLAGGVATGIAEHLGLPVYVVRIAFVILATARGMGIALYGADPILVAPAPDAGRGRYPAWAEYTVAGIAAVASVGAAATSLPSNGLFLPALVACPRGG